MKQVTEHLWDTIDTVADVVFEDGISDYWRRQEWEAHVQMYIRGETEPHFPVPACEVDNVVAMPAERITFRSKAWVLGAYGF